MAIEPLLLALGSENPNTRKYAAKALGRIDPAGSIRLVDALIKANKRFDLLILPGKAHSFADYQPYHPAHVGVLRGAPARRPADGGGFV